MGRSEPATALLAAAVTQQTQSYCGVASSVAALNALGASPAPELHPGYAYWTQEDAFQYLGLVSCTLATWARLRRTWELKLWATALGFRDGGALAGGDAELRRATPTGGDTLRRVRNGRQLPRRRHLGDDGG